MADQLFDREEVRDLIRRISDADRARGRSDVTVEEILRYQAGEMAEAEAEDLRERLSLNTQAARLAADLALFPDIELDDLGLAEAAELTRKARRELDARLSMGGLERRARPVQGLFSRPRLGFALAAAFALMAIGLYLRVMSLERQLVEGTAPRANVRVRTLQAAHSERSLQSSAESSRVEIPPWGTDLLLVLLVPAAEPGEILRAEVSKSDDVLWRHPGLVVGKDATVTLLWPRSRLKSAAYEVALFRQPGGPGVVDSGASEDGALHRYEVILAVQSREP